MDRSELAELALPYASELAKAFDARLTLISVIEKLTVQTESGVFGPVVDVVLDMDDESDCARIYLQDIGDKLTREGVRVEIVVKQGDPASVICDWAEEESVDLIVICTHGRSGIKLIVYGSVADRVLRCARVPVLLVRGNTR